MESNIWWPRVDTGSWDRSRGIMWWRSRCREFAEKRTGKERWLPKGSRYKETATKKKKKEAPSEKMGLLSVSARCGELRLAGGGRFGLWRFGPLRFFVCGSVGADHRNVHEMFRDEPDLKLVGSNDVADEQIVGAIVAGIAGLLG